MTRHMDVDRAVEEWLSDGPSQLPDRTVERILRQLDKTKQRRPGWLPWRPEVDRTFLALGGVTAAIVLVVVVGAMFLGLAVNPLGFGGQPSPSPRSDPTDGVLAPGTYAAHPLPAPDDSLTVTFTVPEGWFGHADPGQLTGLSPAGEPNVGPPGGMAIGFDNVTTLNGDPCEWSGTADDVSVGPEVDDLVEALLAQTAYEVSQPIDVTIGGYSGKRVDIVHPTEPFARQTSTAPECDGDRYRIWSTSVHGPEGVYAQGPANRWQTNILDIDGTRLVIITMDFPGTSPADRAEMDAIIDSIVIEPGD